MRKIYFTLFVVFMFLITGCTTTPDKNNEKQLNNPEISDYKNNTIYWNSVSDSDGYIIRINNIEYEVNSLSYKVEFEETQEFTFAIKAKGKTNISKDSEWSETVRYTYTAPVVITKLQVPTISRYKENIVYWNEVNDSNGYIVKINNIEYTTSDLFYQIEFEETQEFTFAIKAKGISGVSEDSDWSEVNTFTYTAPVVISKLPVPTIKNYKDNIVYWNEVNDSNAYVVKINNVEYTTNDLFYEIQFEDTQEFTFAIKALGKENCSIDSDWSSVYNFKYINTKVPAIEKLDIPNITSYDIETNTIYWDPVENAVDYCLKINGDEVNWNFTSYQFSFEDSCEFTLSIKALTKNADKYMDSDWTSETIYTYTYYREVSSEEREIARRFGIGYGYNFIDDEYFNPQNIIKTESIIDLDKVLKFAVINDYEAPTVESTYYYGQSFYDYALDMNADLNSLTELKVPIEGIYIGATQKFGFGMNFNMSNYVGGCLLTATTYETHKVYELTDYGSLDKISKYLSNEFMKLVNKEGDKYSNLTNDEIAQIIINNYGTHMILGVITGAKLEYYYGMFTSDFDISAGVNAEFTMGGSMEIPELIEAQRNLHAELGINTSIQGGVTISSSKLYVYGGDYNDKTYLGNDYNALNDVTSNWLKHITDANAISLGVKNNGLVSIYDIVYQINKDIAKSIEKIINDKISDAIKEKEELFKSESYAKLEKGSQHNPYLVSTVGEFVEYMNNTSINKENNYIKIIADLDFTGRQYNQSIIANLYANLIADTYTNPSTQLEEPYIKIKGINISLVNKAKGNYGLFEIIHKNASVTNLIFESNKIIFNASADEQSVYTGRCGILCSINEGMISNCKFLFNEITLNGQSHSSHQEGVIGTIASINRGKIYDCSIDSSILYVDSDTQNDNVKDSYNTTIAKVGGICGINEQIGDIKRVSVDNSNLYGRACYHDYTYKISEPVCYVGIYVGENIGTISACNKYSNKREQIVKSYWVFITWWKVNDPITDTDPNKEFGN